MPQPLRMRSRWQKWSQGWQQLDWLLLLLSVGMTIFAAVVIDSIQSDTDTFARNHIVMGGIGLVLALAIARCRYERLIDWQWVVYGITNLSLLAVIFIGTSGLGAQRWITIGGFNLQPSEFAKLGLIITLAALLHHRSTVTLPGMIQVLMVAAVPWALVFLQPDLGTSLVFGAITLGMLYWGNAHPGWLVLLVSPLVSALLFHLYLPVWIAWVVAMGAIAWISMPLPLYSTLTATVINAVSGKLGELLWRVLKDYQKDRLISFLDPDNDPLGAGYHLIQSRIAIGAGQSWGRGWNNGTQTQGGFIPEQHTDFIFSAVGEEFGFVGGMLLIIAFWLICLRLLLIAQNSKDNFGSLLAVGVLCMLVFQVIVNVGMTIGLAPVTGIPLPWLSYGRSALLTNFLSIGLVEAVANYRHRLKFTA